MDAGRVHKIVSSAGIDLPTKELQRNDRRQVQVVGPTVTRQPRVDAMLNDIAIISSLMLEKMRKKVMGGEVLEEGELIRFKELCETALRQTRVEIEVEKHVTQRASAMSSDQIRETIIKALRKKKHKGVTEEVIDIVLESLGMAA